MTKSSRRKNTIHSRLFFSMSATTACFMLLLFLCTSLLFYRQFVQTESQNSFSQLDYISGQFTHYLDSAQNFSKSIIIDPTVQEAVNQHNTSPQAFDALDQMNIKNQIARIIQSTSFIYGVTIYNPGGKTLATTEAFPVPANISEQTIPNNGIWLVRDKRAQTNRHTHLKVASFIRPFYYRYTGNLLGYIEISIPESEISAIYKEQSTEDNRTFLVDKDGIVQSTDGKLELDTSYENFAQLNLHNEDTADYYAGSMVFSKQVSRIGWHVIREISIFAFLAPGGALLLLTLVITICCTIACMLVSNRLSRSITLPIDHLIDHTRTIRQGNWTTIEETCKDSEVTQLFSSFNHMIVDQEKLKNDLLESEKMKNRISLDLLQQQVNPHFLYNTLDNICSLAELEEKDTLIDIVMNLSTFYRKTLSSGRFLITVRNELEITRAYLHIMKVRYINKFSYTISCPEHLYSYTCLKLLLQPLVENSIYHGIKELPYPGILNIRISETEDSLCFLVEDNGTGFTPETYAHIWETDSNHFGVKNIDQRIRMYYGEQYGLQMENIESGGCRTLITIGKRTVNQS